MTTDIDWDALDALARTMQARAYCPYSGFRVGAAVLCEDGQLYGGCNVENAAYPASVCAETSLISIITAVGQRKILAMSVIGDTPDGPTTPCGICRQVLFECNPDLPMHLMGQGGADIFCSLGSDLLPYGFGPQDLQ